MPSTNPHKLVDRFINALSEWFEDFTSPVAVHYWAEGLAETARNARRDGLVLADRRKLVRAIRRLAQRKLEPNSLELRRMRVDMRDQDNLATAFPIYVVQQMKEVWGLEDGYHDDAETHWMNEDWEEVEPKYAKEFEEYYREHSEAPDGVTRVLSITIPEWVQPFFTRRAAEEYLEANRHRLREPRIWVDSAYRNHEWQSVVRHISGGKAAGYSERTAST